MKIVKSLSLSRGHQLSRPVVLRAMLAGSSLVGMLLTSSGTHWNVIGPLLTSATGTHWN